MVARKPRRRYWLFKSEPDVYPFETLWRAKGRRTCWDGVRNYQARNLLRDDLQVDDGVLFYHSSCRPMAIVGLCRVVAAGYPDASAWDQASRYHDPNSDPQAPTWYGVDIEAVAPFPEPLPRERLKEVVALADMMLLRAGARLSVQPVSAAQWRAILELGSLAESW